MIFTGSLLAACAASGQTADFVDAIFEIDEAAMIRAVNAQGGNLTDLRFQITAPGQAGAAFPGVASQVMYLQYTSVKSAAPDDQRALSVYVVGGCDGSTKHASVECYDPVANEWRTLPSMSTARSWCAAAVAELGHA